MNHRLLRTEFFIRYSAFSSAFSSFFSSFGSSFFSAPHHQEVVVKVIVKVVLEVLQIVRGEETVHRIGDRSHCRYCADNGSIQRMQFFFFSSSSLLWISSFSFVVFIISSTRARASFPIASNLSLSNLFMVSRPFCITRLQAAPCLPTQPQCALDSASLHLAPVLRTMRKPPDAAALCEHNADVSRSFPARTAAVRARFRFAPSRSRASHYAQTSDAAAFMRA